MNALLEYFNKNVTTEFSLRLTKVTVPMLFFGYTPVVRWFFYNRSAKNSEAIHFIWIPTIK